MGIDKKLEEIRLVNGLKKNNKHTAACQYRFGEDTLVVIKSYMDKYNITNETQAVRSIIQEWFINSVANGE